MLTDILLSGKTCCSIAKVLINFIGMVNNDSKNNVASFWKKTTIPNMAEYLNIFLIMKEGPIHFAMIITNLNDFHLYNFWHK